MPFHGARTEEQLRADLRIREAVSGESGDLLLLRGTLDVEVESRASRAGTERRRDRPGSPPFVQAAGTYATRSRTAAKTLYCYSPSLVPTPADWPPDTVATGYWLREQAGTDTVDPALDGFVAAGPPPIYVGFGSSVGPDPAGLGAAVSDAVHQAGVCAVVASGWGAMSDLRSDSDLIVVESAPHQWLFPRVAAVVHHGGAGTTAAGLVAARPTVVCPFRGDQHFWGAAVHRAGAGPQPLAAKKLASASLASAIRTAIGDSAMHARAAELSERIAQEDGATRASEQIESTLA